MKTIKEIRDEVLKQQQYQRTQLTQELTNKLPNMIANAVLLNDIAADYIGIVLPLDYANRLSGIPTNELTEMFKIAFKNAVGAEISSIEWQSLSNRVVVKPATSFEL